MISKWSPFLKCLFSSDVSVAVTASRQWLLKAGSHIIAAIVSIAAVSSKSGLTIGPII